MFFPPVRAHFPPVRVTGDAVRVKIAGRSAEVETVRVKV
jgi:hypothetical protein